MPPPDKKPTTLSFFPRDQEDCPFWLLLNRTHKPQPSSQYSCSYTSCIGQHV